MVQVFGGIKTVLLYELVTNELALNTPKVCLCTKLDATQLHSFVHFDAVDKVYGKSLQFIILQQKNHSCIELVNTYITIEKFE